MFLMVWDMVYGLVGRSTFHPIFDEVIDENRVIGKVTFEKPARFHGKTVGPFATTLLDELRGLAHLAGVKCKRRPDAEIHTGWEAIFVGGDPELLLGAAKPHPDEVGARAFDFFTDPWEFIVWPFSKGWRVAGGDADFGKFRGEYSLEFIKCALFST